MIDSNNDKLKGDRVTLLHDLDQDVVRYAIGWHQGPPLGSSTGACVSNFWIRSYSDRFWSDRLNDG